MRKVILATIMLLALALALSCSNNNSDDNDLIPSATEEMVYVQTYSLKDITENSFTYIENEEFYECWESGLRANEAYERQAEYSISNNILTVRWNEWNEIEYNFNGNQNGLTGTWTRNIDKDAHCKEVYYEYEDEYYTECSDNYAVIKAVFTPNTLTLDSDLTSDYCLTGEGRFGIIDEEYKGWTIKAVGCFTAEYSKGSQKITVTLSNPSPYGLDQKATYNGKTCLVWSNEHSYSERVSACQKANAKFLQEEAKNNNLNSWCRGHYYYGFLGEKFKNCLKNNGFPEEFLSHYNDEEEC
ncbi:MAG: hypothetical protein LBU89_13390 [Fibromonadaceae bacterium]|jgi:hypothetical protein|nr:hypothetical protein [Fibromonadaceae bacterium]